VHIGGKLEQLCTFICFVTCMHVFIYVKVFMLQLSVYTEIDKVSAVIVIDC